MKYTIRFCLILFLPILACRNQSDTKKVEMLPTFDILLEDSVTRISTSSVKEGTPTVLLYFSPDCEHCQDEIQSILKNMDLFKEIKFYFVTIDPFERMKAFTSYYKLNRYSNIIVGKDDQFFLLKHFKGVFPPYLVLYDRKKRQQQAFEGQTNIDVLIKTVGQL